MTPKVYATNLQCMRRVQPPRREQEMKSKASPRNHLYFLNRINRLVLMSPAGALLARRRQLPDTRKVALKGDGETCSALAICGAKDDPCHERAGRRISDGSGPAYFFCQLRIAG